MDDKKGLDIDEALDAAGSWGRYQKIMAVLSLISAIPNSYAATHYVFSHYEAPHHCTYPPEYYELNNASITQDQEIVASIIPFEVDQRNQAFRSPCTMYKRNYSHYPVELWPDHFRGNGSEVTDCMFDMTYDFSDAQETAVTEFSMVCEDDWKKPVATSLYHVGAVIGTFLAFIADWHGRRPLFVLACGLQVLSQVLSAVAWSYPVYCFSILMSGIFAYINYTIFYVLVSEITDRKWRNFITSASSFGFSIGYCTLPLISYLFRSWRVYMGVLAFIGAIIYIPCCRYFPESCRWLAQKGRSDKAVKYLGDIARVNKTAAVLNDKLKEKRRYVIAKNNMTSTGMMESMRVLFRSGITTRFLTCMFGWAVTASLYFFTSVYPTGFSKDRYINILLGGLVEMPSCLLGFVLLKCLGRPRTAALLMVLSGVSTIALPMIPEHLQLVTRVLAFTRKACTLAAYNTWYLISSEVIPTLQRSASMSASAFAGRLASLGVPYFMYLRKYSFLAPEMTMGIAAIASGIFGIMLLPETLGVELPDTVQEARENRRFYRLNIFKKFSKENTSTNRDRDGEHHKHEHEQEHIPMI